eukprot:31365-Pelagococcus_subviridis.AAC.24
MVARRAAKERRSVARGNVFSRPAASLLERETPRGRSPHRARATFTRRRSRRSFVLTPLRALFAPHPVSEPARPEERRPEPAQSAAAERRQRGIRIRIWVRRIRAGRRRRSRRRPGRAETRAHAAGRGVRRPARRSGTVRDGTGTGTVPAGGSIPAAVSAAARRRPRPREAAGHRLDGSDALLQRPPHACEVRDAEIVQTFASERREATSLEREVSLELLDLRARGADDGVVRVRAAGGRGGGVRGGGVRGGGVRGSLLRRSLRRAELPSRGLELLAQPRDVALELGLLPLHRRRRLDRFLRASRLLSPLGFHLLHRRVRVPRLGLRRRLLSRRRGLLLLALARRPVDLRRHLAQLRAELEARPLGFLCLLLRVELRLLHGALRLRRLRRRRFPVPPELRRLVRELRLRGVPRGDRVVRLLFRIRETSLEPRRSLVHHRERLERALGGRGFRARTLRIRVGRDVRVFRLVRLLEQRKPSPRCRAIGRRVRLGFDRVKIPGPQPDELGRERQQQRQRRARARDVARS